MNINKIPKTLYVPVMHHKDKGREEEIWLSETAIPKAKYPEARKLSNKDINHIATVKINTRPIISETTDYCWIPIVWDDLANAFIIWEYRIPSLFSLTNLIERFAKGRYQPVIFAKIEEITFDNPLCVDKARWKKFNYQILFDFLKKQENQNEPQST